VTITFHTPYPNTPASLTFGGRTDNLTTDPNGDLFWLEIADGIYPYSVTILGRTYSGTITVTSNNGYVDVVPTTAAFNPLIIIGGIVGVGAVIYIILRR
jgi:hypothetical protein